MPSVQFGGPIGPFLDNVQQRGVPVSVHGTVEFNVTVPVPDPQRFEDGLRNQLLGAIRQVIGVKMASGQLQFRNLGEGTLGDTPGEIIATSGLAQQGVQIGNLAMQFAIDDGPPQREVRANIHIGGFHVQASSTGGINAGSLANQALEKAKSAVIWYVMGAVLVAVIGGVAWWYVKRTVRSAIDQSVAISTGANLPAWDGKTMFLCGGNQDMKIDGVTTKLPATAITASGNCNLTISNSNITGAIAIEAGGNATVTVQGGSLTGSDFAVHAAGNAKVTLAGTKITGTAKAFAGASIKGP